jgi:hypothetical protein
MRPSDKDKIERMIRDFQYRPDDETLERTRREILDVYKTNTSSLCMKIKIWRTIMKSPIVKLSAALVVLLVVLSVIFFEKTIPEAYAVEQTIEALKKVKTVYFQAELYKQGDVECWMKFDGENEKPTHVCLYMTGMPRRKIDSPAGSFAYNTTTNRFRKNLRDERRMNWYPDFDDLLKESLKAAAKSDSITITREKEPGIDKEMIIVKCNDEYRTTRYLIDPKTKLPVEFTTIETRNEMYFMRKTIAVENMRQIEYHEPLPEELFAIPSDAEEVFEEVDVVVTPDHGIQVADMSREQACKKLVEQAVDAMNKFDFKEVKRLYFPFMDIPDEQVQRIKQLAEAKGPVMEILEMGTAYEDGQYWFQPCKVRELGTKIKDEPIRIRFYTLDGTEYCIIALPD